MPAQPFRFPLVAMFVITFLTSSGRASAQDGTVTDDAFASTSPSTELVNLNGQGISLIVAGSAAKVGIISVGATTTYVKFQFLSSLPPNTTATNVAKATLKLYLSPLTQPTGSIDVHAVLSPWTESTLSPSAQPKINPVPSAAGIPLGPANSFVVVDVTKLVQAWLNGAANGGFDNDGIALEASTAATYAVFDSKESVVTSHLPQLEIVMVDSGPQGTTGPAGPQGPQGTQGSAGSQGPAGTAATVQVGTTMTVPAGTPASVLNGGTANAAVLNFLVPQGAMGLTGAPGAQGPIGINNRGQWNTATTYNPNDSVFDSASYWLALATNTGLEPSPTNANWQLLAGGIVNRGAWAASNNYNVNDVVLDPASGSSWLASQAIPANTPNSEPSSTNASWQLLAAQGATGPQGPAGQQGPQGVQGLMGVQGPPGPMPAGAAITTTSNTFTGNQTINGNLILGAGGAIQYPDGSMQSSALAAVPSGFMIMGATSPTPPAGYTLTGSTSVVEWTRKASLPTGADCVGAASANGIVYEVGGTIGFQLTSSGTIPSPMPMESYDPATDTWTQINLQTPDPATNTLVPYGSANLGDCPSAVGLNNGAIYALDATGAFVLFSAANAVVTQQPFGPANSVLTTDDGISIVAVGQGGASRFDFSTRAWAAPTTPPISRTDFCAAFVNGVPYVLGGAGPVNTVEVLDTSGIHAVWKTVAPMTYARQNFTCPVVNGEIYAIGGRGNAGGNFGPIANTEVYNPVTDTWSIVASLPTPRFSLGGTVANGTIYTVGGDAVDNTGTQARSNAVEAYGPTTVYTFSKN